MAKKCILERALKESEWARLKPGVKHHYNISEEGCMVYCKGTMHDVRHNVLLRPLLWAFRPLEALVPFNGKDIGCNVTHIATENSLVFRRAFDCPNGKGKIHFNSTLRFHNGELVEFIAGGIGMRLSPTVTTDGALIMKSLGYVIKLGSFSLYIPAFLVPFGHATITEQEVTPTSITMDYVSTHPVLGKTMGYSGTFKVNKAKLA